MWPSPCSRRVRRRSSRHRAAIQAPAPARLTLAAGDALPMRYCLAPHRRQPPVKTLRVRVPAVIAVRGVHLPVRHASAHRYKQCRQHGRVTPRGVRHHPAREPPARGRKNRAVGAPQRHRRAFDGHPDQPARLPVALVAARRQLLHPVRARKNGPLDVTLELLLRQPAFEAHGGELVSQPLAQQRAGRDQRHGRAVEQPVQRQDRRRWAPLLPACSQRVPHLESVHRAASPVACRLRPVGACAPQGIRNSVRCLARVPG